MEVIWTRLLLSCPLAVALLTIALASTGCGSNRTLQSVTLTPASADAKNYPNGQVRLGRHRYFQQAAVPVAADQFGCALVRWRRTERAPATSMPNVTVDQNGVAQCRPWVCGNSDCARWHEIDSHDECPTAALS